MVPQEQLSSALYIDGQIALQSKSKTTDLYGERGNDATALVSKTACIAKYFLGIGAKESYEEESEGEQ